MRYTLAKIMSWRLREDDGECRLLVRRLMGGKKSVTLLDILCCDDLPDADAVWAATRIMDDRNNRLFACDCAESVLHLAADPRCTKAISAKAISAKAIRVARRFADGLATADELWAAWVAALDAGKDAADATVFAATDAAAYAADAHATLHTPTNAANAANAAMSARAAVRAATYAAVWAAAYAAACGWIAAEAARSAAWAAAYAAENAAENAACADQRQALLMLALAGEIE